jgi:hypothetical protein
MKAIENLFEGKNKKWSLLVICAILMTAYLAEYDLIMRSSGSLANSASLKKADDAIKNLESSATKSVKAEEFKHIAKQFEGSISAKTIINTISEINTKHKNSYISGSILAKSLPSLSEDSRKEISEKMEKIIITPNKITVKLKQGVPYVKLKNQTKNGKVVTIKLNQGGTFDLTENSTSKLKANLNGILIWASVNYADISALSIKSADNTLSVFTTLGVGFWTTHELGSVSRRYD